MKRFTVLILCGMASICHAADTKDKTEIIDGFDYGLVTNVSSNKQAKNSSPHMRNVYIDKKIGSIAKGNGFIASGSTPTLIDVRFGDTFYLPDGSKRYIVSDSSIVLMTVDFRTFTLVKAGLNRTFNLRGKQIEDDYWFTNGSDDVFVLTSTLGVIPLNGTGGYADVPAGRDIEYKDGRVWVFNTPDDASALYYSLLRSTNSTLVNPTDPRAWPTDQTNLLYVGRGDGEIGIGLKYSGGKLNAFKENSRWIVTGSNQFNYDPIRQNGDAGCVSADSITDSDGYIYCQGRDGFYQFSDAGATRITDAIQPDIDNVVNEITRSVTLLWDTKSEFERGAFTGTTVTANGILQPFTSSFLLNTSYGPPPDNQANLTSTVNFTNSGSTSTPFAVFVPTFTVEPNYLGFISSITLFGGVISTTPIQAISVKVILQNLRTGHTASAEGSMGGAALSGGGLSLQTFTVQFGTNIVYFTGQDINTSQFLIKHAIGNQGSLAGNTTGIVALATASKNCWMYLYPSSAVQFISEVATATSINLWDRFDAVGNTQGGSIEYFYRVATSPVNIATYPWITIPAGSIISATATNVNIQWSATMTLVNFSTPTELDYVTIKYLTGNGSNTRAFGKRWLGRWWLAVSTESTGNYPLIYVKSKISNSNPNAWMVFDGMPLRSFWKDKEDVFYGGSSTAPIVYRLDYGTNYNGAAIDAFYETPDLPLDRSFYDKIFKRWLIDVDQENGANLLVGASVDEGSFIEQSHSLDGSGRLYKAIFPATSTNVSKERGKTIRFRIRNNELDKGMTFNALGVIYQDTVFDQ